MSWASQTTTQAVSKENLLEIIKAEVTQELEELLERQRAHLCTLIYGDAKTGKSGLALDCRTTEEIVEDAIKDAKFNAKNNNVTNINFYCGDLKDILDSDSWNNIE